jgi:hypothetical protein
MLRKSLFWGLALLLGFALISLVLRGRRLEKKQAGKPMEVIQESTSTPIRALGPKDLELVNPKMHLEKNPEGKGKSLTASHEMGIRNVGRASYGKIQLSIDYIDRRGKILATKPCPIAKTIMPGDALQLADIKIEGVPVRTTNCRISIIYAEIGSTFR